MRVHSSLVACAALLATVGGTAAQTRAQTGLLSHSAAEFASHDGTLAFLGAGVALPLLTDGSRSGNHALRTGDALLTSAALSEGLKLATREQRPDGTTRDSFPSGHATAAFAVAAMEAHYHRSAAPLWYLGAAAIADSRVTLRRHYPRDVIAGGILGVGVALLEIHAPRGFVLSPFISRDRRSNGGETRLMTFSTHF